MKDDKDYTVGENATPEGSGVWPGKVQKRKCYQCKRQSVVRSDDPMFGIVLYCMNGCAKVTKRQAREFGF